MMGMNTSAPRTPSAKRITEMIRVVECGALVATWKPDRLLLLLLRLAALAMRAPLCWHDGQPARENHAVSASKDIFRMSGSRRRIGFSTSGRCPISSWPGLSRPSTPYFNATKTWMPGTRPGMTMERLRSLTILLVADDLPRAGFVLAVANPID